MRTIFTFVLAAIAATGCTSSGSTSHATHGPDLASPGGQCASGSDCVSGSCNEAASVCECSSDSGACNTSADCCISTDACVAGQCESACSTASPSCYSDSDCWCFPAGTTCVGWSGPLTDQPGTCTPPTCVAGQACSIEGSCDIGVIVCPSGPDALGGCADTGQSPCGSGTVCEIGTGTCIACFGPGALADIDGPCCSGISEAQIPSDPYSVQVCCSGTGGPCSADGDCCTGFGSCVAGTCQTAPPTCVDGGSYTMSVDWNQSTGDSGWECSTADPQTGGCYCPGGCLAYGPPLDSNPYPSEGPNTYQCQ
jgi:hypothetical protein